MITQTKPIILLEIDWEQNLRAQHKRPSSIKPGTGNAERYTRLNKTLASRIKEIKRMIVSGEASYK
jgi:hypothetical protein